MVLRASPCVAGISPDPHTPTLSEASSTQPCPGFLNQRVRRGKGLLLGSTCPARAAELTGARSHRRAAARGRGGRQRPPGAQAAAAGQGRCQSYGAQAGRQRCPGRGSPAPGNGSPARGAGALPRGAAAPPPPPLPLSPQEITEGAAHQPRPADVTAALPPPRRLPPAGTAPSDGRRQSPLALERD